MLKYPFDAWLASPHQLSLHASQFKAPCEYGPLPPVLLTPFTYEVMLGKPAIFLIRDKEFTRVI